MSPFVSTIRRSPWILDMVHHNPGEPCTDSQFNDPRFLRSLDYTGQVLHLFDSAQFGLTWDQFDPDIFPRGSDSRQWVVRKAQQLEQKYELARQAGLAVFCQTDMIVFPKRLADKYAADLAGPDGRFDISRPATIAALRALLGGIFERFPQLEGLVVRTGETYLHDAPFHTGSSGGNYGTHEPPLSRASDSHIAFLQFLRQEVCERLGKTLIYRAWDFGWCHSLPRYYCRLAQAVAPHPKLLFSLKHTITDFWRGPMADNFPDLDDLSEYWLEETSRYGVPFNPCLGLGPHPQIVEVQCQREYEGKGAHPNYIARGVIEGFDEIRSVRPDALVGLRGFASHPNFAGLWTWSRGGGEKGPFVPHELWCELNAAVLTGWVRTPWRSEEDVFFDRIRNFGLSPDDAQRFRQICLLSTKAVMKGHYSDYGNVFANWTRNEWIGGKEQIFLPYFVDALTARGPDAYLKEKQESVTLWSRIEALAHEIQFADPALGDFVRASSSYGRFLHSIFAASWTLLLLGWEGDRTGCYDKPAMAAAIRDYHDLWAQWRTFAESHPLCPTLYKDYYGGVPGIGASVAHYAGILQT